MPTTLVSRSTERDTSALERTGSATNESPSCERTSAFPKRSSIDGLKTWTARRAMIARLTRLMSSSLFPLNIEPTMTSRPAWPPVRFVGT